MPDLSPLPLQPAGFQPGWLLGGGHRQTIWAALRRRPEARYQAQPIPLRLRDGDWVVLHDDQPAGWRAGDASLLLLHGLCGCHAASYMVRLAARFNALGVRTFRLDMRGCGAAAERSHSLTHAGRSDDALDALEEVARRSAAGPIWALGTSLGGNQLLRAIGRLESEDRAERGDAHRRLTRIAAVAPPVDLAGCSDNMQRWILRPYNWYFIRQLLSRIPPNVRSSEAFQQLKLRPWPRTLRELDSRITAPLGGFRDVDDYYHTASAGPYLQHLRTPSLIVASEDDPIVPVETIQRLPASAAVVKWIVPRGGHAGYIGRRGEHWLDDALVDWFFSA